MICSRSTRLIRSISTWPCRYKGTRRRTITYMMSTSRGMMATTMPERTTSWFRARTMPPMPMAGAATSMVKTSTASAWICWTSLVARVTRLGTPNVPTSWEDKDWTLANSSWRSWRPSFMATVALKYPAASAAATWTAAIAAIQPPSRRMRSVFPLTIPSSMTAALSVGRKRLAVVWTNCSTTMARTAGLCAASSRIIMPRSTEAPLAVAPCSAPFPRDCEDPSERKHCAVGRGGIGVPEQCGIFRFEFSRLLG
ncbi:hypothetical protein D9M72_449910 [compost metagenome]